MRALDVICLLERWRLYLVYEVIPSMTGVYELTSHPQDSIVALWSTHLTRSCLANVSPSLTHPLILLISPIPSWIIRFDPAHVPSTTQNLPPLKNLGVQLTISLPVGLEVYLNRLMLTSIEAMIFLKDDVLLERELTSEDIKPRLLGHWGTCPGLTLVYAHLNRIIKTTGLDSLLVVGPGKPFSLRAGYLSSIVYPLITNR